MVILGCLMLSVAVSVIDIMYVMLKLKKNIYKEDICVK